MRNVIYLVVTLAMFSSPVALAQAVGFLAIPSSGFTPRNSTTVDRPFSGTVETLGYTGNKTGTARFFGDNDIMFAPVNLPHGSTVTELTCGGHAPMLHRRVSFVLRRNEPQQANVNMAGLYPIFKSTSFQIKSTTSITSPIIDNRKFNYYIAATIDATNNIQNCRGCSVNRCTIAYTLPSLRSTPPKAVKPVNRLMKSK